MNRQYEIIKFKNESVEVDVKVSPLEDTVWLTKGQMAVLFDRDRSVVSKHINNIYNEGELDKKSTCAKNAHVVVNRERLYETELYNLDVVISVGYRVKSKRGILFRQWANNILKEYLIKGYAINKDRTLVTNENYVRLINKVESLDERVSIIENEHKLLEYKNKQLFFDGEFYDAYTFIQQLFEKADNEIIIIDNYIDRSILDRLVVKKKSVKVIIYTTNNTRILTSDIITFNSQYGILEIKKVNNVHDRFIIIDRNIIYHLGHSIKDLGKKIFSINELDNSLIEDLLNKMKEI